MDEREIGATLEHLDRLLDQLERTPGATAEAALEAVGLLTRVYGEALARMVDRVGSVAGSLAEDELLGHLFALHGIHPASLEDRVERALERVRPYARSHGGEIELAGIDDGVVRVRLAGACDGCTASQATLEGVVREAVLAAVPELTGLEALPATAPPHPAPVIPAESLLRRPAPAGGSR
jgi:Fe-S cluster biogenesis protein NfuA